MTQSKPGIEIVNATPYVGSCPNCGRAIKAALFFDWERIDGPSALIVRCGCQPPGLLNVELRVGPGNAR